MDFIVHAPMTLEVWRHAALRQVWAGAWRHAALFNVLDAEDVPLLAEPDALARLEDELREKRGIRGPVALVVSERLYDRALEWALGLTNGLSFSLEVFTDVTTAQLWLDGATRPAP